MTKERGGGMEREMEEDEQVVSASLTVETRFKNSRKPIKMEWFHLKKNQEKSPAAGRAKLTPLLYQGA